MATTNALSYQLVDAVTSLVDHPVHVATVATGGYDFAATEPGVTIRVAQDDTQLVLYVFTGGRAMVLRDRAVFSPGLVHMAALYVAAMII